MRKSALFAVLALSLCTLAVQLITVERVNPPISPDAALAAPPQVETILTRACYDCHSSQTRWPWYSRVALVSWLVARDVTLARKELNFSEWGSYYPQTRRRKLQWMGRVVRERSMPPWAYRLMHPGARLTGGERVTLERWIESEIAAPVSPGTTDGDLVRLIKISKSL
jgi:hypothetical protein